MLVKGGLKLGIAPFESGQANDGALWAEESGPAVESL
jgi:hypothetical protein